MGRSPGALGCLIAVLVPPLVVALLSPAWPWACSGLLVVAVLLEMKVRREGYEHVAETFGLLVSLNYRDNIRQLALIVPTCLAGWGCGALWPVPPDAHENPAGIGMLLGLTVGFLVSGLRLWVEWRERHRV